MSQPDAVLLDLYDTLVWSDWWGWQETLAAELGVTHQIVGRAFDLTRPARSTGAYADADEDLASVPEPRGPVDEARNALLLLMVLMQNVDAVNARSETISVLRLPLVNNPVLMAGIGVALGLHVVAMYLPWLQGVLAVVPPTLFDWLLLPVLAVTLLVLMEAQKYWRRWRAQST